MTSSYQRPDWFTRNVFNPFVGGLGKIGISMMGSRVLEVRGRMTGEVRRTPVNLLRLDGQDYLVAPRGITNWVRNARADGGRVTTVLGKKREEWIIEELPADEAVPVLREYLRRWKWEVGTFFPPGTSADMPDADLAALAPKHPSFRLLAR
ncbi:nitroreductase/quinone reductase family protein [Promicromonospora sp. Populi]|uniref:nitroreductase/quinone reductase family protein n=1 Tax=Promicromonospora sp. Populi TaxID=3239420 RepID=UPI0034E2DCA8